MYNYLLNLPVKILGERSLACALTFWKSMATCKMANLVLFLWCFVPSHFYCILRRLRSLRGERWNRILKILPFHHFVMLLWKRYHPHLLTKARRYKRKEYSREPTVPKTGGFSFTDYDHVYVWQNGHLGEQWNCTGLTLLYIDFFIIHRFDSTYGHCKWEGKWRCLEKGKMHPFKMHPFYRLKNIFFRGRQSCK